MSFARPSKLLQSDTILVLLLLFWQIPDTACALFLFGLVARVPLHARAAPQPRALL